MRDSEPTPKRPTIQVRAESTIHRDSFAFIAVEVLSSGTGVVSAATVRSLKGRLCTATLRHGATCPCAVRFGVNRTRKGLTTELYIEPAFRFAYGVDGEPESRTGLAFSYGEAVGTAKGLVRTTPDAQPCISIVQLMYDPKAVDRPGIPRIVYVGKWDKEADSWIDYVHPANPAGFPLPKTQPPTEYTGREFPQLRTALEAVIPFGTDPGDAK